MGSGDKHHHLKFHVQLYLPNFHFHHHHHGHGHENIEEFRDIPRGCVAVMVGQGEEQQRFVIPVMHINHPLFIQLLKGAEDEVEFHHNGPINIPCHVEEFRYVEDIIDKDNNNHHLWCFKA
ncbi:auxin-responsive protein SAUR32-like [Lycium barbarum]|uniref:auxin-responsive protein SAUR32-like n=1 Tax=Lycium barbarum TaxID=112863 RepID=UPI00293EB9EB|nr:auxin-responsive protein SAUR32-like [Lycium barbarum]